MQTNRVYQRIFTIVVLWSLLLGVGSAAYAGTIAGTVYKSDGTTAIDAQIEVQVYLDGVGLFTTVTTNLANGTYTATGLSAGTYLLRTNNMGQSDYVNECWASGGSVIDCDNIEAIILTAGGTASGTDFQLDVGTSVSGTVYQSNGTTPVTDAEILVSAWQDKPCYGGFPPVSWTTSNSPNGTYTITGLPAGTYYVGTDNQGQSNYLNESWTSAGSTQDCNNAESFLLSAGTPISGKDFQLDLGAQISGTLYQSDGSTPITDATIEVTARQGDPCRFNWGVMSTDTSDGTYTLIVQPGTYYLETHNNGQSNYVNEWWESAGSTTDCGSAESLTVAGGSTVTGKDFQLDLGGYITGHVYEADGVTPIDNLRLFTSNQWNAQATTESDGSYTITGLPSGSYPIRTCASCDGLPYVDEYYDDAINYNDATQVAVTAPNETPNIDFSLDPGATISGTVYESDGTTPITGDQIGINAVVGNPCGWWQFNQYTQTNSSDGTYTVTGLPAGTYYLRAQGSYINYLNEWWADPASEIDCNDAESFVVPSEGTVTGKDFQLDVGGSISGHVYEADGVTPIANINVSAFDYSTNQWMGNDNARSDGSYTITGLPAGTYRVETCAQCSGLSYADEFYDDTYNYDDASPVSVTLSSDTPGIDFSLEPGATISGTVYQSDGTTPITGVEIEVQARQGDPCGNRWTVESEETDSNGTYTITGLPAGTYYLQTDNMSQSNYTNEWWADPLSGMDCNAAESFVVPSGGAVIGKDFQLDLGGSLSGRVDKAADGTPIANLHVFASDYITNQWIEGAHTEPDGSYTITGLPSGSYRVETCASCDGLPYVDEFYDDTTNYSDADPVIVTAPNDTPNIDFSLEPGATISGTVYQSDGTTPVTGVEIRVEAVQGNPCNNWWTVQSERTDSSDGTYTIMGLPAGTYYLKTANGGQSNYTNEWWATAGSGFCNAAESFVVPAGGMAIDKNFQLDLGGCISGHVYENDGVTPIANLHVPVHDYSTNQWMGGANTEADGSYTLTGLPAGTYRVQTCAWDCSGGLFYADEFYDNHYSYNDADPVSVSVNSCTPNIDFELAEAGSISGHVYENDGTTPIVNMHVYAQVYATDTWVAGDNTDGNGEYTLTGVPSGTYRVGTCANCNSLSYLDEFYNNKDYANADPVVVTAPNSTASISFQLSVPPPPASNFLLWTR